MYSTYYGSRQDGYGYNADMLREGFDLLEARADCLGWWSVARRVLRSYGHQPIIRLRRSSDSTEQDFYGIGPQGEVSTAEVRAWNGWNLLARTEELDNAYWTKQNSTVSSVSDIDPVGTQKAFKIILNNGISHTAATADGLYRIGSLTSGIYNYSVFAKAAEVTSVRIREGFVTGAFLQVDLLTGAITNGAADQFVNPVATSVGNGWWRISFTTSTTTAFNKYVIRQNATGDGASGVLVFGLQVTAGASLHPYEPRTTTGAGDSFLVTLYDQSGLARNFTQSTTTLQPIICEQGVPVTENGRLAAKFVAADARRMSIASSTAMFNALHTTGGSVLAVSRANDTAAVKCLLATRNTSSQGGFTFSRNASEEITAFVSRLDVAGVATAGFSVQTTTTAASSTAVAIVAALLDPDNATAASRSAIWQNGALASGANAQTGMPFVENAGANLTLGSDSIGSVPFDGTFSEAAAFSDLISTADRTAWQSRSGIFYGVTIS